MASSRTDVVVLGAGIVGVGAALHLQAKGRAVTLVDRVAFAASETSFGNSGIVQSEAVFPYMFPRAPGEIARAALGRDPRVHIRYASLPAIAPWLWRYFLASAPSGRLAYRDGDARPGGALPSPSTRRSPRRPERRRCCAAAAGSRPIAPPAARTSPTRTWKRQASTACRAPR